MKYLNINNLLQWPWALVFVYGMICAACTEIEGIKGPKIDDQTIPGQVSGVEVENTNGAAVIRYQLPNSPNLLYVLAEYEIRAGVKRETKASYYKNELMVEGFEGSKDYEVKLTVVSKSEIKSEPVYTTVHPDIPSYQTVKPTIQISPDFGGFHISAYNEFEKPIGMVLYRNEKNVSGEYPVISQYFTDSDSISYSVRGYDSIPHNLGMYITDQFGNVSDTLFYTVKPYFEQLLDKQDFFVYPLESDSEIGYGWSLPYLWDTKTDVYSTGWHTNPGGDIPMICTFGIGQLAQLSRFEIWARPGEFTYGHGNPKEFSLWGANVDNPGDAELPVYAPVGTEIGDWTNLSNYHFPDPPSGFPPGAVTEEDEAFIAQGVNFNIPVDAPPAKFLRIAVSETWSGGDFAHIMEVSVFGNPLD
ncbi:DUF5000 domain-containing lipoprotein [Echinicola sp. 20G]|uniref:DUF5000 domain-containing lipoprotein n=1 Tax=Echinicola sp. 20G TaxID=2781961 RepID=UPI0019111D89|nr:DUF5000 domain-containing lipoprotein [Echinicola sp. 20G]